MGKIFYPDFFNDVFGPIMQPGSSTNFAGNSRLGRAASFTVKQELKRVKVSLNPNSQGYLGKLGNMMEDRAFLGGLQGFAPDDERLFDAHALARDKGISYEFGFLPEDNEYPDTITFDVENKNGDKGRFIGASIGGGMIKSYEINSFPIVWQGDTHGILLKKTPQTEVGLRSFLQSNESAVVDYREYRNERGEEAWFIELSRPIEDEKLQKYFGTDQLVFPALLPVLSFNGRQAQLFKTVDEWIGYAEKEGISFVDAAIAYEKAFSGWDEKQIWDYFENIRDILYHQIHALEDRGIDTVPDTPLLPVYGKNWNRYKQTGKVLQDPLSSRIMDYAFSVNAKIPGVRIVPGPMGTGGGYLFSAMEAVRESRGYSRKKQLEGLVVAAQLGAIAFGLAHASGLSGCAGESGICCAMASGGITWMAGGTGQQVQNAASMALQSHIGIPCDPIPGGKEFPCLTRTVRAALSAPLYADMALCGIDPIIPYHEALYAIEHIRQLYPKAVCGPECGLNCTAAAARCQQFLSEDIMKDKLKWEAPEV
ncbi:MAG: L-serine ammonia-lyase, iron-sulfur-dependent, subunit alpha [Spirochaetaceae bacterium]|jgi:L-serine dehydratase|nr:L-serine ammonia-lyase, iron-sulfur-dependent, subunit alpha [Spirochaetaceae bacterium]